MVNRASVIFLALSILLFNGYRVPKVVAEGGGQRREGKRTFFPRVDDVQGSVEIKFEGRLKFIPLIKGANVASRDTLRFGDESSRVNLICPDASAHRLTRENPHIPCDPRPVQPSDGRGLRSLQDQAFPVIVSPRASKLLNARPMLKWTAVQGATEYNVAVRGPGVKWVTTVTSSSEIRYPAAAPELRPGNSYKLIVEANGHASTEEPGLGLGFTIISDPEASAVRAAESDIGASGLPLRIQKLLISDLYISNGLNSEAIEILTELTSRTNDETLFSSLGELYVTVGLPRHAEASLLRAIELSQKADDLDVEAIAQEALGRVYRDIGNSEQSRRRRRRAAEIYERLGDPRKAEEVRK
jgi:hypothetical protein